MRSVQKTSSGSTISLIKAIIWGESTDFLARILDVCFQNQRKSSRYHREIRCQGQLTFGSYQFLKRHAPVGAPLRMKKGRIKGATPWREDDQQYTSRSVFLKLCSGVWTNHSLSPHLLQQW
jgi:hypothetical protein